MQHWRSMEDKRHKSFQETMQHWRSMELGGASSQPTDVPVEVKNVPETLQANPASEQLKQVEMTNEQTPQNGELGGASSQPTDVPVEVKNVPETLQANTASLFTRLSLKTKKITKGLRHKTNVQSMVQGKAIPLCLPNNLSWDPITGEIRKSKDTRCSLYPVPAAIEMLKAIKATTDTFWPLKKGIPTEEELVHLADNIQQDWKRLGAALGLKEKQLKAIEVNNPNDVYERAIAVLQKWKKKMGRKATYHKLAIALNDQLVQRPGLVKTFSTDNADNNVWLLKKGTPTDQELQRLAEEIPEDWKRIGRAVGLKEKHLKTIEIDHADDVCERALATLYKWQEKQGQEATYERLAQALDDELVQRRDLVEIFCCDIYPRRISFVSTRNSADMEEKESYDVPDSHDITYQDEKKGQLRERGQSTRLQTESKEEPSNTEKQLSKVKPEGSLSFQETLQTWKRRESTRTTKEKTPFFRQSKAKTVTCPEGDIMLGEEIQHVKDTMDAAMQRMNAILEHVHEPSNTAADFPVAFSKEEKEPKESESHKEIEQLSDVESSLTVIKNENMDQAKQEFKRHMEETSPSCEVSPDPFFVQWPWSSVVFTSNWWQWLFSGDER